MDNNQIKKIISNMLEKYKSPEEKYIIIIDKINLDIKSLDLEYKDGSLLENINGYYRKVSEQELVFNNLFWESFCSATGMDPWDEMENHLSNPISFLYDIINN